MTGASLNMTLILKVDGLSQKSVDGRRSIRKPP